MRASTRLLIAIVALLIAEIGAWTFLRYQVSTARLLFVVTATPWLLLLPRLFRGDRRAVLWAVLLTSPYLAYGMMEILANPGAKAWAAGQVLIAFALFVAAIADLRLSRPKD